MRSSGLRHASSRRLSVANSWKTFLSEVFHELVNAPAQPLELTQSRLCGLTKLDTMELIPAMPGLSPQLLVTDLTQVQAFSFREVFRHGCLSFALHSLARRSSWALTATTTVLSDISTAPTAGESTIPLEASTPAASGMAMTLYPEAHQRFWTIFR